MKVREITGQDAAEWLRMRRALWPEDDHRADVDKHFRNELSPPLAAVFVLERANDSLAGFLELGLRRYAEGCESTPVPFIEGWFVDADVRTTGLGRALVKCAESWARRHGFHEIASDVEMENDISIAAHRALGYEEVSRLICFRRRLPDGGMTGTCRVAWLIEPPRRLLYVHLALYVWQRYIVGAVARDIWCTVAVHRVLGNPGSSLSGISVQDGGDGSPRSLRHTTVRVARA